MSGGAFAVTHHAFSSGAGRTSDGNGSHASTLKSPSYTKSVSWQHYQLIEQNNKTIQQLIQNVTDLNSQVSSKEQKVDELQNQNIKLISLIDEKDLHIAQLSTDLERANTILRKINSTPVIRHLLRMLNIK
ncbi:hypothetical protein FXK02_004969 [Escherichia coli]